MQITITSDYFIASIFDDEIRIIITGWGPCSRGEEDISRDGTLRGPYPGPVQVGAASVWTPAIPHRPSVPGKARKPEAPRGRSLRLRAVAGIGVEPLRLRRSLVRGGALQTEGGAATATELGPMGSAIGMTRTALIRERRGVGEGEE